VHFFQAGDMVSTVSLGQSSEIGLAPGDNGPMGRRFPTLYSRNFERIGDLSTASFRWHSLLGGSFVPEKFQSTGPGRRGYRPGYRQCARAAFCLRIAPALMNTAASRLIEK
jgi:hypothetical protein